MRKVLVYFLLGILSLTLVQSAIASDVSQQLVHEGRSLLFASTGPTGTGLIAANSKFQTAVQSDGADQEARFFCAITRLLASLVKNGNEPGLETLRDLLESFGVTVHADNSLLVAGFISPPVLVSDQYSPPATIPSGAALQGYLAGPFLDLLAAAHDDLNLITNSPEEPFSIILTSAETGDLPVDIDFGDVLALKSFLLSAKAVVHIMNAYNLEIDLRDLIVLGNAGVLQIQRDLLDRYQDLLHLKESSIGAASLVAAKAAVLEARNAFAEALNFVTNETDGQDDDLFSFASQAEIDQAYGLLNVLNELQSSLEENRPALLSNGQKWILTTADGQLFTWSTEQDGNGTILESSLTGPGVDWQGTGFSLVGFALTGSFTGNPGVCPLSAQVSATLIDDYITNGAVNVTDCNGSYPPVPFTGVLLQQPNKGKIDFNYLFGNTGKTPFDLRSAIPSLNATNLILAESPIALPALGGLWPDFTTKDAFMKLFADSVIHTIPVAAITVDGSSADWTGISSMSTDDDEGISPPAVIDLQTLSVTMDAEYLYWMIDLRDTSPKSNSGAGYYYTMFSSPQISSDKLLKSLLRRGNVTQSDYSLFSYDYIAGWQESPDPANGELGSVLEARLPLSLFTGMSEIVVDHSRAWDNFSRTFDMMESSLTLALPTTTLSGSITCEQCDNSGQTFITAYDGEDPSSAHSLGTAIIQGAGGYSIAGLPIGANVYLFAHWDADDNGILTYGDYIGQAGPILTAAEGSSLNVGLATIIAIEINGPSEINEESSTQFNCRALLSDGTSKDCTGSAMWSVDSAFTEIDNNGYLTSSWVASDLSVLITASYAGCTASQHTSIKSIFGEISGTVLDHATGQPVAGVWVYSYEVVSGNWQGAALTQADGTYTMRGLGVGNHKVYAEPYPSAYIRKYYPGTLNFSEASLVQVSGQQVVTGIDFQLEVGGQISGVVTDANDTPLGGVQVCASGNTGDGWGGCERTAADGTYTIRGVAPGTYRIDAFDYSEGADYIREYYPGTYNWSAATLVPVVAQETVGAINFRLELGGKKRQGCDDLYNVTDYAAAAECYEKLVPPDYLSAAGAYGQAGITAYGQNDYQVALNFFLMQIQNAERTSDNRQKGYAYYQAGYAAYALGLLDDARSYYRQAGDTFLLVSDSWWVADSYGHGGIIAYEQGDYQAALNFFLMQIQYADQTSDNRQKGYAYYQAAYTAYAMGQLDDAMDFYRRAGDTFMQAPDYWWAADSYWWVGNIAYEQKDYQTALDSFLLAIQYADQTSDYLSKGNAFEHAGHAAYALGELDAAKNYYQLAGDNFLLAPDAGRAAASYGWAENISHEQGDLNNDGDVDGEDLAAMATVYNGNTTALTTLANNFGR